MGIHSGANLDNVLPGLVSEKSEKVKGKAADDDKRPVWKSPVDTDMVPVTVKVETGKKKK
jgi:hypothetical protein